MGGLGWQDWVCLQHTNMNWSCEVKHQGCLAARQWDHGVHHIGVYGIHFSQWASCWHDPGQWAGQLGWSSLGGDLKMHGGATHYLQLWCWAWHGLRLLLYCWSLQAVLPWCMLHCTLGHRHCLSLSLQDGCLLHFHSQLYQQTICHLGVCPWCWLVLCKLSSPFPGVDDGGLHSSVRFSSMFAHSARAAALHVPVASFGTAVAGGIPCRTVVMARGVWVGAVGALWGTLLWLALLRLMALAEGMDGLAGTHCSHSWFNSIIHATDLQ